jgi:hypothetical protein
MTYPIEKNVPKPTVKRPRVRRKYPLEAMQVGDSFFVPNRTKNNLMTFMSTEGARLGMKFATRLVWRKQTLKGWVSCEESEPGAVQGIAVWRDI